MIIDSNGGNTSGIPSSDVKRPLGDDGPDPRTPSILETVDEDEQALPKYELRAYSSLEHLRGDAGSISGSSSRDKPLSPLPTGDFPALADVDAQLKNDGRLDVSFGNRFSRHLPPSYGEPVEEVGVDPLGSKNVPKMNVCIMIVGSRGDVQPYLALGQKLQQYGHTVRFATHPTFCNLVKDAGLRFFSIGGNPRELMSYMVRNPGLIPGFTSLANGDIGKKQSMVGEILEGCFRSCFAPDDERDGGAPFAADAIISNPPTFAHIHCAEALGIPLLLSFTMPWCATSSFPHPLVNIKHGKNDEPRMVNYLSYGLVDVMTWQGLGHTINKFRMKRLGLSGLGTPSAVSLIQRCGIPWTYCLSPALVPKPSDWMGHIDVAGFYFLDLAKGYTPPKELQEFLNAGVPPIYIGFGSIVLDDPQKITKSVLSAVALCGVRALISPGWGGLDKAMIESAGSDVLAVENVPHDWLFEHVSAVCHHGGAGTTAIGLRCGKPTIIVPFFGDQPWWAAQVARRGAGPLPIYPKHLTADTLANAIKTALLPETRVAAMQVGETIKSEDGTRNGLESFHKHLPLLNMRCDLDASRVAVWYSRKLRLRLSAFSAQVLAEMGELKLKHLELHRAREYDTHIPYSDPVTGTVAMSAKAVGTVGRAVAKLPTTHMGTGVAQIVGGALVAGPNFLQGFTEGMHNMPKLYGGAVRETGKVNGVGSGLAEGGKAFAFGIYDGIAGLVTEPKRQYQKHGVLGGAAGVVVGATSLVFKPVTGTLALVSHPLEGVGKDMRALFHKNTNKERHATRCREAAAEFKRASQAEKDAVIRAYDEWKANKKKKKE